MTPDFYPFVLAGIHENSSRQRESRSAQHCLYVARASQRIVLALNTLGPVATTHVLCGDEKIAASLRGDLPSLQGRVTGLPAPLRTAPACALATAILVRSAPEAILGIVPATATIVEDDSFAAALRSAIRCARVTENLVLVGSAPGKSRSLYGCVELASPASARGDEPPVLAVRALVSDSECAYGAASHEETMYLRNSGIMIASVRTFRRAMRTYTPKLYQMAEAMAEAWDSPHFPTVLEAIYPACQDAGFLSAVVAPFVLSGMESKLWCVAADAQDRSGLDVDLVHDGEIGREASGATNSSANFRAST